MRIEAALIPSFLAQPLVRPVSVGSSECASTSNSAPPKRGMSEPDSLELSPEALQAAERVELELDEGEQQQVEELKTRDREVRAHEAAHVAAAGPYAGGGPSFTYQQGPDGRAYAVGGEVQIDVSPVDGDPAATIRKMQQVRAAALAPADPSGQDRAVAAAASRQEAQAAAELSRKPHDDSESGEVSEDAAGSSLGHLLDVVA